ncbi:tetratricopeptide repeat protein [Candidatus Gracilibacteria bacterium]|nr:tetratricopeptide repeat protein [Candidatus Gracilibacteria bacterium]
MLIWYPWQWALGGSARSVQRTLGDWALARGAEATAEQHYLNALEASPTPDGWLALGNLYREQGKQEQAEFAYRAAWDRSPRYMGASGTLGDLLREQGRADEARIAFSGRYTPDERMVNWTYDNLAVRQTAVDIGAGLDFGYISGVYAAEEQQQATARWTDGSARLRFAQTAEAETILLTLRLAAPHPDAAPIPLMICSGDSCTSVALGPTWRTIRLLLPIEPASRHEFQLTSPTFTAADGRQLGVLIDWMQVKVAILKRDRGYRSLGLLLQI